MTTISSAISEFLLAGEANGLKPATTRWYVAMLKEFGQAHGGDYIITMLPATMRRFVIDVRKNARSEITAIDKIVALHAFWAWAAKEYGCPNPMAGIKRPKRPTPGVKAPSVNHVQALARVMVSNARDVALFVLVIDTGLRIEESLSLKPEHIDFFYHQIKVVRGKGDKTRIVPMHARTEAALVNWFSMRGGACEYVFTQKTGERLTYAGARQILRRAHQRAGLEEFFSWHKYRHFSAQQYRRAGGDVFDLQKILGHEEITTTVAHYGNFLPDELVEKHEYLSAVNVLEDARKAKRPEKI
jgi:site-specific recombinase XerD